MLHNKSKAPKDRSGLSAQQLKEKLDQNYDLTIINVLSQTTYIDCHITGSINIPFDRLVETVASWEKDKEIVLYCAQSSCPKSQEAYEILLDMGFNHVDRYQGGMKEWLYKKYPSTGTCTMRYLHE